MLNPSHFLVSNMQSIAIFPRRGWSATAFLAPRDEIGKIYYATYIYDWGPDLEELRRRPAPMVHHVLIDLSPLNVPPFLKETKTPKVELFKQGFSSTRIEKPTLHPSLKPLGYDERFFLRKIYAGVYLLLRDVPPATGEGYLATYKPEGCVVWRIDEDTFATQPLAEDPNYPNKVSIYRYPLR